MFVAIPTLKKFHHFSLRWKDEERQTPWGTKAGWRSVCHYSLRSWCHFTVLYGCVGFVVVVISRVVPEDYFCILINRKYLRIVLGFILLSQNLPSKVSGTRIWIRKSYHLKKMFSDTWYLWPTGHFVHSFRSLNSPNLLVPISLHVPTFCNRTQ